MKKVAQKLGLRNKEKETQSDLAEDSNKTASTTTSTTTNTKTADMASSLPKTFKAAVLNGTDKPLEIKELPMLEPKAGEILVKVQACGVCHSDHHVQVGDFGPQ